MVGVDVEVGTSSQPISTFFKGDNYGEIFSIDGRKTFCFSDKDEDPQKINCFCFLSSGFSWVRANPTPFAE